MLLVRGSKKSESFMPAITAFPSMTESFFQNTEVQVWELFVKIRAYIDKESSSTGIHFSQLQIILLKVPGQKDWGMGINSSLWTEGAGNRKYSEGKLPRPTTNAWFQCSLYLEDRETSSCASLCVGARRAGKLLGRGKFKEVPWWVGREIRVLEHWELQQLQV